MSAAARDRARAKVAEAGGPVLLERLDHLDAVRAAPRRADPRVGEGPRHGDTVDVDVAIVGGGLSLLLAPVLAKRGLRVAVFDRALVGEAHREWNASRAELDALVTAGLLSAPELEETIVARYRHGTCSFAGGGSYPVQGVLDRAVDAGSLLGRARALASDLGVELHDHHTLVSLTGGSGGVRLAFVDRNHSAREITARYAIDARGASSPSATADLVCPTVGGVVRGLTVGSGTGAIDPTVGEILATTEGIVDGKQHVWEAFPGRSGETTVYLFHYARPTTEGTLVDLYARFFEALPRYKTGDFKLVRPTFGYIPGWSRLVPPPRSPHPRVVLVGDAAARHSPLTYCGFGATLRSIDRVGDAFGAAILGGDELPDPVVDDRPVHAFTGALSALMASGTFHGNELNALLDAAFSSLHGAGNDAYAAVLRDTASTRELITFLRRTSVRHPAVWTKVATGLGPSASLRWARTVASRAFLEATSRAAR